MSQPVTNHHKIKHPAHSNILLCPLESFHNVLVSLFNWVILSWCIITTRRSSFGKVMFSQASVSHSVRGRVACQIPSPSGCGSVRHHPPRQTPPRILRNTVNKRAVHILLECILVIFVFWLCSIKEDQFVKENIKKAFANPNKRAEWIKQYQVRDKMYTGVFPKWSETFIEFSEFRESDNC